MSSPSTPVVLVRGYRLLFQSAPVAVPVDMALSLANGVVAPVIFAALGAAVSRLQSGGTLVGPVLVIVVTFTAGQMLQPVQRVASVVAEQRVIHAIRARIDRAVVSLPGLAHFDDPKFADALELARRLGPRGSQLIGVFESQVTGIARLAALSVLVSRIAPWAPLLLTVPLIPEAVMKWRGQFNIFSEESFAVPAARAASYARGLAFDAGVAKEVRVFGLAGWLLDRYSRLAALSRSATFDTRWQLLRQVAAPVGVRVAAGVAALWFAVTKLANGEIDAGSFSAFALAMVALVDHLGWMAGTPSALREVGLYLGRMFDVIDLAVTDPQLDVRGARPVPKGPLTVRFEQVTFAYPSSTKPVLNGIDLELKPGTSLALVGTNGSGKSTVVRLLCRLYDPDDGRITINGIDVREFDLTQLRAAIAVDFQDALRFQLDARTNLTAGCLGRADEDELVTAAAESSGAAEVVALLPEGWDTVLAPTLGGTELSEGQWQRLTLGRTVFSLRARGTRVVVFDEPTAAVDVRVEQELVRRFRSLVGGCASLLISHRLSTVRLADEIAYLEDGRVAERGTHEELVAAGGRYAELWALQASRFRKSGEIL